MCDEDRLFVFAMLLFLQSSRLNKYCLSVRLILLASYVSDANGPDAN